MKCLRCGSTKHLVRGCPQPDLRPATAAVRPAGSATAGAFFILSYMVSFDDDVEDDSIDRSGDFLLKEKDKSSAMGLDGDPRGWLQEPKAI
eukprot:7540416-Heterocapsa_arctica.AAC.1